MICHLPRPEVAELDLSAERIWPPEELELAWGWRCRLDRGVSRRANSVLAAAWTGEDFQAAAGEVAALYRSLDLRPCFMITPASEPEALDDDLAGLGYQVEGESFVMRADPAEVLAVADTKHKALLSERPTRSWLAAYGEGRPLGEADAKAAILGRIDRPVIYAEITEDGEAAAVGAAIKDKGRGWFNCMQTRSDERRRGLARSVLTVLATWLVEEGVSELVLQVEADNPPARGLYEGFGFETVYSYHYRALP